MASRKSRSAFASLARHKRSNEVIRIKGRIQDQKDLYGGLFTSHQGLRDDESTQWFDFYFLGSNRFTFWNAEIITAGQAFLDMVSEEASSRAYSMLTQEEISKEFELEFAPADISSTGRVLTYEMVQRKPIHYPQFQGRTLDEELNRIQKKIMDETPPVIFESFKIDYSFQYGIGLEIVRDVDCINRLAVEDAIEHFYSLGEKCWQSPLPCKNIQTLNSLK